MAKTKSSYIVKNLMSYPDYERKDIKINSVLKLETEVGDKFVERGFLVKGSSIESNDEKELAKLKKENEALKKENEALKVK